MNNPTKKKIIILCITLAVLLIGAVIVVYSVMHRSSQPLIATQTEQTIKPTNTKPTVVSDPCKLLSITTTKKIFGDSIIAVDEAIKSNTQAINGELAESCEYNYTTTKSKDNQFIAQTYLYKAGIPGKQDSEPLPGAGWYDLNKSQKYAYFKGGGEQVNDKVYYTMRVINGPINYIFQICQPKDQVTYDESASRDIFLQIYDNINFISS